MTSPPLWHALPAQAAVEAVASDAAGGLSEPEAARRLERHGPNTLPEAKPRSLAAVFARQFASPLIYLLLVAAVLAYALGHHGDAAVILAVVVLNAAIGTLQEGRAERSLTALRRLARVHARVVRGGHERVVDSSELVPGDIVVLGAGDAVPADARVVEVATAQAAEAALTGESAPVPKEAAPVPPDTLLADRRDMLYAGTHVTAGRVRALVVATGLSTEIGRIAAMTAAAQEPPTPLERRIAQFGRYVIVAAVILFTAIIAAGVTHGMPLADILMIGISQLVGMVPEGLPVAMTVALAVGVQRMARRQAIVRRLAAVETLGSTTVICTDKTGTLTRNEMTVTTLLLADGRELSVIGVGYSTEGQVVDGDRPVHVSEDRTVRRLLEAGVLCNDADLAAPSEPGQSPKPVGDPTEVALLVAAVKAGVDVAQRRRFSPREAEMPFDSAVKLMATQHRAGSRTWVLVKGAPEVVLGLCAGDTAPFLEAADRMAARALRVLAVATVDNVALGRSPNIEALRGRGRLLGLVGQMDPPRPEAKEAVARCQSAGIRPVMVTGDHKVTGRAVGIALGLAREEDAVVDGRELEHMSDADLAERLDRISVFARVHPAQKLRIIEAYQRRGAVVAMTGDGVNDAPALVRADVGVAMGVTGTEVAKQAAKIVLADDNFATIVAAVEEGRVVYRNIKKAVLLLLATSLAEVIVLLAALIAGYPPPLVAVQILWNNLVTEGLITVNLIMEPAEGDEMQQPPVSRDEPLLTRPLLLRLALMTPAIVASTLGWFVYRLSEGVPLIQAQTETFTLLAVCEWFNVLNCRSQTRSALRLSLLRNKWLLGGLLAGNLLQAAVVYWPPLAGLFRTVPLPLEQVLAIGVVGSLVLWVEEIRKLVTRVKPANRSGLRCR